MGWKEADLQAEKSRQAIGLTVANQGCGREEDGMKDIVAPLVSTMEKVMRPRLNSWKGEHWDMYLEKCT